jgi:transposase-like protein
MSNTCWREFRSTAEEKGRVVAQAVSPGAVVAVVARQHDLIPQQLSNWIKAAKEGRVMLPAPEPSRAANLPKQLEPILCRWSPSRHARPLALTRGPALRLSPAQCWFASP